MTLAAVTGGGLFIGALVVFSSWWTALDPASGTGVAIVLLAAALCFAASGLLVRRSHHGVDKRLISDHSRWLATDETVLILQAPIDRMQVPVGILRLSAEIPPVISVLNPTRPNPFDDEPALGSPLSPAQMIEYARRLAVEHTVGVSPQRSMTLIDRLGQSRTWIRQVCGDLSEAALLEQRTTPIAEWILDNEYIIEGNVRDVQQNLSPRFYGVLPTLQSRRDRNLPRIYSVARELVTHAGLRLDRENIIAFVEAYQSMSPLSIAELWAVPQMLRIALIEGIQALAARGLAELRDRESADFWANRLITANRRDPNHLFAIMAELAEDQPDPSPYFAFQLIEHLYDEEAALAPVQSWLERINRKPLSEINAREQDRQTKDQLSIGNAFTSLRLLALLDWRQIFEHVSRVERLLRKDPSGMYGRMDFATRDRYRRAIEEIARRCGKDEEQVARSAIDLAARPRPAAADTVCVHVGTYLIGDGRRELDGLVGCRESVRFRFLHWSYRHHSAVYLLGLGFVSALLLFLIVALGLREQALEIRILTLLLSLIPVSQLSLEVVNYLVMRIFPPRTLAKMDYQESGIPDAFRTLVVVPMLLADSRTVESEVQKLEIRYLANREDNLLFSLFTDFTDSDEPSRTEDEPLLRGAMQGLSTLNERYGGNRFFLFHRDRKWSESEQKYIGWERKRGKLEELNQLIDGTRPEALGPLVFVGDSLRLADVRFVITLDSDTQLPSGTARQDGRDPGAPPEPAPFRQRRAGTRRLVHDHPAARQPLPAQHERLDVQPPLLLRRRNRPVHEGGFRRQPGSHR